jgi:outer membrane protein assembly factor BamB
MLIRAAAKPLATLGLTALALALGACAEPKPPVAFGSGLSTLEALENDPFYRLGFRRQWATFVPVAEKGRVAHLDFTGEFLVARDATNLTSLIAPEGGEVRWSAPVGSALERYVGATRVGNNIGIATETELYLIDPITGNLADRQNLDHVVNTAPAPAGPYLVFGSANNLIMAHFPTKRLTAWSYGVSGPIVADPVKVAGDLIAFASAAGEVILIDGTTGSATGRYRLDGPVAAKPASDGQRLFVASEDQSLYAFTPGSPRATWRLRTESRLDQPPATHAGRVFITIPREGLTALDAATGKRLWTNPDIGGRVLGVQGRDLILWDGTTLARVSSRDGALVDKAPVPNLAAIAFDRFVDGTLYVAHPSGGISRFNPR